jgi:hypothetical protein
VHVSPLSQSEPVQQGCPGPPQAAHDPADPLVPPPPSPPSTPATAPSQIVCGAVHPEGQHACPALPQVPHPPAVHTPPSVLMHFVPSDEQMSPMQQPPAAHVLSVQHASPGPPQPVQNLAELQTLLAPLHRSPEQHFNPGSPQGPSHVPILQLVPLTQGATSPVQQALPSRPQGPSGAGPSEIEPSPPEESTGGR